MLDGASCAVLHFCTDVPDAGAAWLRKTISDRPKVPLNWWCEITSTEESSWPTPIHRLPGISQRHESASRCQRHQRDKELLEAAVQHATAA
jgi:hypothetical protein